MHQAGHRALALLFSAILLAGCAASSSPTSAPSGSADPFSGKLSMITKFGVTALSPFFENVTAEYTKLHPGVSFELIQEEDIAIKDKEKSMMAAQALPDIFFTWTGNWEQNFVDGGVATDLTSVIGPDTEWGKTFGKAALDAFVVDGKYYGIPLYLDAKFMGYNEKIFSDLGIAVPATFEHLLKACGTIKAAGIEPISFGNKDGWPGLHYLQQLLAYNVPWDVMVKDWNPATATLDHPGYVKSLNEFKALVDQCTTSGAASNGTLYSAALAKLTDGTAAMYYQEILEFDIANAEGSKLRSDGFGFFQLPPPSGGQGDATILEGAPEGYLINTKSKNFDLAVDFMKFATNAANAATLTKDYGQPSAVVGAVNAQTASKQVGASVDDINKASRLLTWLDIITVPEVTDAWISSTQGLVSGERTPESVMAAVLAASNAAK
jgi:raffinose/stachyose/melibiose transport system substrate-binding protein